MKIKHEYTLFTWAGRTVHPLMQHFNEAKFFTPIYNMEGIKNVQLQLEGVRQGDHLFEIRMGYSTLERSTILVHI
jgi:hypothetical protein